MKFIIIYLNYNKKLKKIEIENSVYKSTKMKIILKKNIMMMQIKNTFKVFQ